MEGTFESRLRKRATGGYITGRLKRLTELQAAGLAKKVIETRLRAIAEFRSPQTGPSGEPNQALLAAQASLRLRSGAAQPRLRVKQRLLMVEALTGAGEKNSYVRLLGYLIVTVTMVHLDGERQIAMPMLNQSKHYEHRPCLF